MHMSLRIFLLLTVTAIVGLSLSAKRSSVPISIARCSTENHQFPTPQTETQSPSTTGADRKQAIYLGRTTQHVGNGTEQVGELLNGPNRNQQIAQKVLDALKPVVGTGYDMEIVVSHDVVLLVGLTRTLEQKAAAGRAAASVSESMRVDNRLAVDAQDSLISGLSPGNYKKREGSSETKSDESRSSAVAVPGSEVATWELIDKGLKRGMTQREAFEALDVSHAEFRFGSLSWEQLTCHSRKAPNDQLSMTFTIGRDAYYLTSWYVSPRGESAEIEGTGMRPINQSWWDQQDEFFKEVERLRE